VLRAHRYLDLAPKRSDELVTPGHGAVTCAKRWYPSIYAGKALARARGMKKHITKKRALDLKTETLRQLGDHELTVGVVGGASGSYCADCGTGTRCPELKF
jgi:hypothetical protein